MGDGMNMRFARVGLLLLLAVGAVATPAVAASNEDLLQQLNNASLDAYAAGRQEFIDNPGPLILVGRELTFIWNGQEKRVPYTPQIYTTEKSFAHLFLGLLGVLQSYADAAAENQGKWRPHLEAMRRQALLVMPHLGELGLSGDSLTRNRYMMTQQLDFIDRVLAKGSYSQAELTAFARLLAPLLLANTNEAARAQIDMLHAAVQDWRASVPPEVWAKVLVVIQAPRQPRAGYLQYQYFQYALGNAAATQLVFAENMFDRKSVMLLIGTILADRSVAITTFDEPLRLERDMLSDAADAYLKQLFGKLGRPLP